MKKIQQFLNDNINNISQFEVFRNAFLIHMKNGDTIEVYAENYDSKIIIQHCKFEWIFNFI